MLVLAFARKNFVTNDDQANTRRGLGLDKVGLRLIRRSLEFVMGHVFILKPNASDSWLDPNGG